MSFPFVVSPLSIPAALTWLQLANICDLVDTEKIKMFVEIGIYKGGLASIMMARSLYDKRFKYIGIEINVGQTIKSVLEMAEGHPRAMVFKNDCFDYRVREMVKKDIDTTEGPALIFCDGGDKPKELNVYHICMRPGDFILVHDYSVEKLERTMLSNKDVEPIISQSIYKDATPQHWPDNGLFLIQRVNP